MPRKSGAEIEAKALAPARVEREARPDAPYDLTDEESQEWWAVVDRMPADWFPRETHGLLAQYCRHVVSARRVAQLIAQATAGEELDIGEYDQLLKMQEREGRALSSLATRMRITQQASYDPERRKEGKKTARPWAK
ncbi:hypothetical protein [Dinoroseobacter sp. S375]|uniref:hypothetical protein n=1 Tax=Dinoroseobacter sp. S375 TaxID=3415136 RepID=UPI003C7B1F48